MKWVRYELMGFYEPNLNPVNFKKHSKNSKINSKWTSGNFSRVWIESLLVYEELQFELAIEVCCTQNEPRRTLTIPKQTSSSCVKLHRTDQTGFIRSSTNSKTFFESSKIFFEPWPISDELQLKIRGPIQWAATNPNKLWGDPVNDCLMAAELNLEFLHRDVLIHSKTYKFSRNNPARLINLRLTGH